jgi:hypothetical protein
VGSDCDWNMSALLLPEDERVLERFDVEIAFLNALLTNPVYIEWQKKDQSNSVSKPGGKQQYMYRTYNSNVWNHLFTNLMDEDIYKYIEGRRNEPQAECNRSIYSS